MAALPPPKRPKSLAGRILKGFFAVFLAIWVWLEEWFWDAINWATERIGRIPLLHWLEEKIRAAPRWVALMMFLVPTLVLFPAKILALWLIAAGKKGLGAMVFVVAKVVGTAMLTRIFSLTKPQLLTIGWFATSYNFLMLWKARLKAYVHSMPSYQWARAWVTEMKASMRNWWRARFKQSAE